MNIYPALRFKMGTWEYYTVKMTSRELDQNVLFAYEVHDDRTLDRAIQRELNESRAKKEIVEYLRHQVDRFFSSIVIAAIEGNPVFHAVEIAADPRFDFFRSDHRINESFGVLQFDGLQKYYALDGQHRLTAIKTLLDRNSSEYDGKPDNFENDEFSVIIVVPNLEDTNESFMQKYRRLFSNLNRYAKPTDQATNIIMDEDDTFAILTRRLITDKLFFQSDADKQRDSEKIKTKKGKNLRTGDTFFTSIETLYEMNIELLSTPKRHSEGWNPNSDEKSDLKNFRRLRPTDEFIDKLYEELSMYWDCILDELPVLKCDPTKMRFHDLTNLKVNEGTDHLLFWPIGQQMLAELVRQMLNRRISDPENPSLETVRDALKGLNELEWQLHQVPWQYFLLVGSLIENTDQLKWTMRNEERAWAVRTGRRLQLWILGLEPNDEEYVANLKLLWKSFLRPSQPNEIVDEMWGRVLEMKKVISG